jgi:glycosyltransferase involved in cell wall biosynthesis
MQTYVDELAARLPRVAPDLHFAFFPRGRTLSPGEQTAVPWRLWRAGARMVHFPSPYAPLLAPRPYAVTVHDLIHLRFPEHFKVTVGPYYATVVRAVCAGAARVITDDPRTVPDLERFLVVPAAKVRVVPLGASELFMRDGIRPERATRPYFLYAGNHRAHKDLATLFAAWAALPPGLDVDLCLTGHDDLLAGSVRPRRDRAELRFLGNVGGERLAELYAGTLALVYPSLCEGFGLPMLEAAATGARVIASTSAVPFSLAPYVETFEPGDVRRLLGLMTAAARNENGDARPKQEAQRFARSQTWDRCALATAEVYREILQAKSSR